jgi:predicted permease
VILTLAAGIGANITLVGTVSQLLFRPPAHVKEAERVVRLLVTRGPTDGLRTPLAAANYPLLLDLRHSATAFEGVAGFTARPLSLGRGPEAVEVRAALVTANFFSLMGVNAHLGRVFSESDGYPSGEATGGPALAVLGFSFWHRHFSSDSSVVGRLLRLGDLEYRIVGIAPSAFLALEDRAPDVWLPIHVAASDYSNLISLSDRGRYSLAVVARLRSSTTRAMAEAECTAIWQRTTPRGASGLEPLRVIAAPLNRFRAADAPRDVRVTLWLSGASGLLLLITCANVANLLLSRTITRRQEFELRLALGASPSRLARHMLIESLVLSLVGGAAAAAMAFVTMPLLVGFLSGTSHIIVDWRLLLVSAGATLGTAALVGSAPAMNVLATRGDWQLRAHTALGDRFASRLRLGLIAVQSTVCLMTLLVATLFVGSFRRASRLDLGVDAKATIRYQINLDNVPMSREALEATYADMLSVVRALPGVVGAAIASSDPYAGGRAVAAHAPGQDPDVLWAPGVAQVPIEAAVGDGFFRAVGANSLRGRDFQATDTRGAEAVAIINEPLATLLYGLRDPIGECIILPARATDQGAPCVRIVGVLGGVWYGSMTNRDKPMVYIPLAQRVGFDGVMRPRGLFVRVAGDRVLMAEQIRRMLQATREDLPAIRVALLEDAVTAELRPWQLGATIFGLFACAALIVAVAGLYALVAFIANQRAVELGIRRALGATQRDLFRTLARPVLLAVVTGIAAGLLVVWSLRSRLAPLLFQISPLDPVITSAIATLLVTAAGVAVALPVQRIARIDPSATLRVQ